VSPLYCSTAQPLTIRRIDLQASSGHSIIFWYGATTIRYQDVHHSIVNFSLSLSFLSFVSPIIWKPSYDYIKSGRFIIWKPSYFTGSPVQQFMSSDTKSELLPSETVCGHENELCSLSQWQRWPSHRLSYCGNEGAQMIGNAGGP